MSVQSTLYTKAFVIVTFICHIHCVSKKRATVWRPIYKSRVFWSIFSLKLQLHCSVRLLSRYVVCLSSLSLADRAFRCTAPTVWSYLNSYIVDSGSLAVFKSRLKTFLFRIGFFTRFSSHDYSCTLAPRKSSDILALYKSDYYYYYYYVCNASAL